MVKDTSKLAEVVCIYALHGTGTADTLCICHGADMSCASDLPACCAAARSWLPLWPLPSLRSSLRHRPGGWPASLQGCMTHTCCAGPYLKEACDKVCTELLQACGHVCTSSKCHHPQPPPVPDFATPAAPSSLQFFTARHAKTADADPTPPAIKVCLVLSPARCCHCCAVKGKVLQVRRHLCDHSDAMKQIRYARVVQNW